MPHPGPAAPLAPDVPRDRPPQTRRATGPAEQVTRTRRITLVWPAVALAAIGVLAISETSHQRSTQALQRLEQRASAMQDVHAVLRNLLDVESSHRGFLLTGRRIYLAPAEQAAAQIRAALTRLEAFHPADAPSQAQLDAMRSRVTARLADLKATVRAHDAGGGRPLATLLARDHPQPMQDLRLLADDLAAAEDVQLAADRRALLDTLRISRIGVNASAALGLLALVMLLRQSSALHALQRRHAQALQDEQACLGAEVARRAADLAALAGHLQTAREDERSRLARDLHDELGAPLLAAQGEVRRLRADLAGAGPQTRQRLDQLAVTIDGGISLKERIVDDLRPAALTHLGLAAALDLQARTFAERGNVHVQTDLRSTPLSEAAQITVYRLVQEALTNIAKYARAAHVRIAMQAAGPPGSPGAGSVRISVEDDGAGFDPTAPRPHAHGLMGMRCRVEAVGGHLALHAAPGRGTRIEATLPALRGHGAD